MGAWQAMMTNTIRTLEECRYYPFNYNQVIGKGACQVVLHDLNQRVSFLGDVQDGSI